MKTTKNYFAILMMLVISAAGMNIASFAGNNGQRVSAIPMVRYQVKINLPAEQPVCSLYQVEILDGSGYQVVPAKIYISGVTLYEFFEKGPVNGIRIARFVRVPIDGTVNLVNGQTNCGIEYYTRPAVLRGPFLNGSSYLFELYPETCPGR